MIKINLVPVKRKKKPKPLPMFLVAMVALFLASGAAVVYYNFHKAGQIEKLENQKKANEEKIQELELKVAEVKNFEKLNAEVSKRKEIIEQLTKSQSVPVRILDEVSRRLTDGVWLTSMTITEKKIAISGSGFSNTDIVSLVQSLKGSELFANVELKGTTRLMVGDVETYTFNMEVELKI